MNINKELKDRLDALIKERNEVEEKLKQKKIYLRYLELQQEISEVSRAVKALEHSCPNYYMNQAQMSRQGY